MVDAPSLSLKRACEAEGLMIRSIAMIPLKETPQGITFAVKVQPRARKNAITGTVGDALKLVLTAPPVEGKANAAVIEFLAGFFDIPRSSVTIASGATSRLKIIRISGANRQTLEERLRKLGDLTT
jgi:uncharacterized protein (TIGR00251 family)